MKDDTAGSACCSDRVCEQLRRIHAPVAVGIPPANAFRDLVQLPDGELRHYGFRRDGHASHPIYLASHDCGLSWQAFDVLANSPGACVQSPWSGDWLTLIDAHDMKADSHLDRVPLGLDKGLYVCRSMSGIDGPFAATLVSADGCAMPRQPLSLRQRRRWIMACQRRDQQSINRIFVWRSDDDGRTWAQTEVATVPPHVPSGHHRGVRWQNYGCEPTVVELAGGRLWMVIRTSHDNHYEAFSDDAGESWTTPAPSRFYGTITMPTLFRLRDGRILFFWCNTTPLPELDHELQAELLPWERQGFSEDVFTNRDACHVAISEDNGGSWIGFRELMLNERRNDADFRSSGGNGDCLDKSVHQSQALELPEGKVLVSSGQHPLCRRLLIFDPAWLYETERADDFHLGLGGWSTQQYVKGIVGNFRGVSGHCAYNRRPGAQLIRDPDGAPREVLQIARQADPRLVHEQQGAVWNFPAGAAGELRLTVCLPTGSQGFRLCLMDRWFNPVDAVAHESAQYALAVGADGRINGAGASLPRDAWHVVTVRWSDAAAAAAEYRIGEGAWHALPLRTPSRNGISYLHVQSTSEMADADGVLLREVAAQVGEKP